MHRGHEPKVVGTSLFASGAATDVPARKAGGTYAVQRSITLVAPLHAALDGATRRPYHAAVDGKGNFLGKAVSTLYLRCRCEARMFTIQLDPTAPMIEMLRSPWAWLSSELGS